MKIEDYERLVELAQNLDDDDGYEAYNRLRAVDSREGYSVESSTHPGTFYTVRFTGRADDDNVLLWSCDCPAGRRGRWCKHVQRVTSAVDLDPTIQ
jgi:hypothetical protein